MSLAKPRRMLFSGRFEVLNVIASGGFGVVYEVRDTWLNQVVALKVLTDDDSARFAREVLLLRRLPKDRFVSVFDYVVESTATGKRRLGYSMELFAPPWMTVETFVDDHWPKRIADRVRIAVRLTSELLEALHVMHANDVVHRDITPFNLWTERNAVRRVGRGDAVSEHTPLLKVADLGIARDLARAKNTTIAAGNQDWAAPEQFAAKPQASPRTDIHAAALIGYYLLTGDLLREADRGKQVPIRNALKEVIRSTRLATDLASFIARATKPLQAQRYPSAVKARRALDALIDADVLDAFSALDDLPDDGLKKDDVADLLYPIYSERYGWKNYTRTRRLELREVVDDLRGRGVLALSGHRYRLV